jgi:hypothetical protein
MLKDLFLFSAIWLQLMMQAHSTIVKKADGIYVQKDQKEKEIFLVNQLIKKGELSNLTLYHNGGLNLISFKTNLNNKKLYSVDSKGFIYDIKPYSDYQIAEIYPSLHFKFKELPKKIFWIDDNGYFLEK